MTHEWEKLPNGQKFRLPKADTSPYQKVWLKWPAIDKSNPQPWDGYEITEGITGELEALFVPDSTKPVEWNTYTVSWTETEVFFYLNGELTFKMTKEDYDALNSGELDDPEGVGTPGYSFTNREGDV